MSIFGKGQLKIAENAMSVLEQTALSTAGFMIADNNKDIIPAMEKWHAMFNGAEGFMSAQALFQDGMVRLIKNISDKPFLQLQLKNAMSLLQISVEGPKIEADLGKYKKAVDAFMTGVLSAK